MKDPRPVHGLRVELRRAAGSSAEPGAAVSYEVLAGGAAGAWSGHVEVNVTSGAVELSGPEPRPPGMADLVRAVLRVQWRAGTWPRRLTRWRATST